jgi:aspartate/methionine/tyrosine aminotransferase
MASQSTETTLETGRRAAVSQLIFEDLIPSFTRGPNSRINLSHGNPAFSPPELISSHVARVAQDRGNCLYRSSSGEKETLDALVGYFRSQGITGVDRSHVIPGYGITHLYSLCLRVLRQQFSEKYPEKQPVILMTAPSYGIFADQPSELGFAIETIPLRKARNFQVDASELDEVIESINRRGNQRVAALYNVNPHNPLGTVIRGDIMANIARVAQHKGITIIDDMAYAHLELGEHKAIPIATIDGFFSNTITLVGTSKPFCSASIRAAAACAPRDLVERMQRIIKHELVSICSLSQATLVAAFRQDADSCGRRNEYLNQNRLGYKEYALITRALIEGIHNLPPLSEAQRMSIFERSEKMFGRVCALRLLREGIKGVKILNPDVESGYFFVLDFSEFEGRRVNGVTLTDSLSLTRALISQQNLLVLPGDCMLAKEHYPLIARINFAAGPKAILRSLRRILSFVEALDR